MDRKGFTFIEVLISLFIFSILLLGFDVMRVQMLREAKAAYYWQVAVHQLDNFIEKLSATPDTDLDRLLFRWNEQNKHALPQGHGEIETHRMQRSLAIFWGDHHVPCHRNKGGISGCIRVTIPTNPA